MRDQYFFNGFSIKEFQTSYSSTLIATHLFNNLTIVNRSKKIIAIKQISPIGVLFEYRIILKIKLVKAMQLSTLKIVYKRKIKNSFKQINKEQVMNFLNEILFDMTPDEIAEFEKYTTKQPTLKE